MSGPLHSRFDEVCNPDSPTSSRVDGADNGFGRDLFDDYGDLLAWLDVEVGEHLSFALARELSQFGQRLLRVIRGSERHETAL